jgi:hypothetical protein
MPGTDGLRSGLAERYEIERELGAGGMATVYLARDIKHDREVALKVLRPDLSAVIGTERFLSEVRITARLDHPHILTLIDSGEADGILYYVLPYVRGESLRAKLNREKQLSLDEALSITRQVASALDYAHGHGVVHRDIKPENILLHEGEAVLADFGIALAVKEAGGNRLTETGLSLGTPQYMSPEQATGDRALDKRSDIYSLGAVFYEMLGGEPPVTGGTAQAMIAKLLTEKPVRLRVLRNTIPLQMELATEKALSKVPADRFSSAGDFVRALSETVPEKEGPSPRKNWLIAAAAVAVLAAGALIAVFARDDEPPRAAVTLRDRIQLTNTGNAFLGTISDDGKAVVYAVTDCGKTGCRYALELKDTDGPASRRILDGATAIYRPEISPDRRNVLMFGSIKGVFGSWIISLLGGPPRFVHPGIATFYAGGDSLLLTGLTAAAKSVPVLVAGLDGIPVDSIEVNHPADGTVAAVAIPGSNRFAIAPSTDGRMSFHIVGRDGREISSIDAAPRMDGGLSASSDALWLYLIPPLSANNQIVRVPFDARTGKLAARGDTVYSGRSSTMSVTADGGTLLYDEGISDYSAWLLPVADFASGKFSEENRLVRSTGTIRGAVSPDGAMTLVARDHPQGGLEFSVIPAGSRTEIPIPGRHRRAAPFDSTKIKVTDETDSSTTLYLYDYRTRRRSAERTVKISHTDDITRVGDAWAWIPSNGTRIEIQRDSDPRPRRLALPAWYKEVFWLNGSPDGSRLAIMGYQAPNEDSLGVGFISLADNKFTQVYATFGEGGGTSWMNDGSLVMTINDTPESETLWHWKEGQPVRRIGSTQRLLSSNTVATASGDLKRVFLVTRDDRRDLWMSKVVK